MIGIYKILNILQCNIDGSIIKEWVNMNEILNKTCFHNGNILRCCKKGRKTYKGFIWKIKNS